MKEWRKYHGALIPSSPPHHTVNTENIRRKISDEGAYFARWVSDFDCKDKRQFWFVICDQKLDISDYSRNTRNQIRRGLRNCRVELIDKEIVMQSGFESYYAAFKRYSTHLKVKNIEEFKEDITGLSDEWEFWGIFHEDKLIGYSQNRIIDDYCDYSTIKFHPDYLNLYPSYALFYTMNQYYLNERNFRYVNDGARSIAHQTNIQDFLIQKFKFRKAYCKMHIVYNNYIKLLIRLIFPFRNIISRLRFGLFKKLNILISQEKILRSYD